MMFLEKLKRCHKKEGGSWLLKYAHQIIVNRAGDLRSRFGPGPAANRSHVAGVVIIDDTIHNGEAAKSKAKDDKEKATKDKAQQDSVDNL
jgi:hypothetical protein